MLGEVKALVSLISLLLSFVVRKWSKGHGGDKREAKRKVVVPFS